MARRLRTRKTTAARVAAAREATSRPPIRQNGASNRGRGRAFPGRAAGVTGRAEFGPPLGSRPGSGVSGPANAAPHAGHMTGVVAPRPGGSVGSGPPFAGAVPSAAAALPAGSGAVPAGGTPLGLQDAVTSGPEVVTALEVRLMARFTAVMAESFAQRRETVKELKAVGMSFAAIQSDVGAMKMANSAIRKTLDSTATEIKRGATATQDIGKRVETLEQASSGHAAAPMYPMPNDPPLLVLASPMEVPWAKDVMVRGKCDEEGGSSGTVCGTGRKFPGSLQHGCGGRSHIRDFPSAWPAH